MKVTETNHINKKVVVMSLFMVLGVMLKTHKMTQFVPQLVNVTSCKL